MYPNHFSFHLQMKHLPSTKHHLAIHLLLLHFHKVNSHELYQELKLALMKHNQLLLLMTLDQSYLMVYYQIKFLLLLDRNIFQLIKQLLIYLNHLVQQLQYFVLLLFQSLHQKKYHESF